MTAEFDREEIEVQQIIEGLTAVMLAPVVLPLVAGIDRPLAKKTIKEAIAFSQRCKEAVADAKERFEDIVAEAQAEVDREQQSLNSEPLRPRDRTHVREGTSEVAGEMLDAASELDRRVAWLTNNYVDLRLLIPLGLGTLALGQLITKGPQLDKIPWYNLAWYAFDSFYKLDRPETKAESEAEARPVLTPAELSRENKND